MTAGTCSVALRALDVAAPDVTVVAAGVEPALLGFVPGTDPALVRRRGTRTARLGAFA